MYSDVTWTALNLRSWFKTEIGGIKIVYRTRQNGVSVLLYHERKKEFYWTQKGPSKGGKGRIFRANIEMPTGTDGSTRDDIEVLLENLPEPIDLEIDTESETLYWTDRGYPPTGNTLNKLQLGKPGEENKLTPKILSRNMHEAMGLKLDLKN